MSDLKAGLNDDEILLSAYRTLSRWLHEPLGLISQAIPKTPNSNNTNALKIQALVQKYDSEIKRFKDAVTGKTKPHFLTIEPPTDRKDQPATKAREQELEKDIQLLHQGLSILKKSRRPYANKLLIAKINQFRLPKIIAEGEQINQQAEQIITEIQDYQTKTEAAINKYHQLESHFNDLNNKYNQTNLDPTKITALALTFTQKLPTTALDFTKG